MKHDIFLLTKNDVKEILKSKKIRIDYTDGDIFSDFINSINHSDYTFCELRILFLYSYMMDCRDSTPYDVEFSLTINS